MAFGDPYIGFQDLAAYLGAPRESDSDLMTSAIGAASAWVNDYCARDFNKTDEATSRVFVPVTGTLLNVDDFFTADGLEVATTPALDQVPWDPADFVLRPFNGVEGGVPGFPFRSILAIRTLRFPCGPIPRVTVTARWGWAAVPVQVLQATRILAALYFRLKDAPLGVAGFGEFGPVRVRDVPQVTSLLDKVRSPALTGPLVA